MTVFVTNYHRDPPKIGCLIPVECHLATTWHRQLAPANIKDVEVWPGGPVERDLQLVLHRYGRTMRGRAISLYEYRFNVLGALCAKHFVQTDAFTEVCRIYDRDGRLVLRQRDVTPWAPTFCSLTSLFRRAESRVGHAHVLAAMLMNDPIVDLFTELQ